MKYGFVPSFTNETIPMWLLCEKTFSNHSTKPATKRNHMERIRSDERKEDLEYLKMSKQKLRAQLNWNAVKVLINKIKAHPPNS